MARASAIEPAAAQLGDVLRGAGFDEAGILGALGRIELEQARLLAGIRPALVAEPLATLVELFHVQRPVPRADAAAVAPVDALLAIGLLDEAGGDVVSRFQISCWMGLLVAHDPFHEGTLTPDFVAGGSGSATTLARSTVRILAGRMLDAGSGSGVQALLAAQHSREVVAVDLNPRAVELTRINAALNGFPHVEARQGDWFEPVAGEEFDLVVANAPYVVSPDTELLFRDGDRKPDDLYGVVPEIVRGVAGVLAPGGIGHVLCDWGLRNGEDAYAPVAAWTEGLGRDVCVVEFGRDTPLHYAARWNSHVAVVDPPRYAAAVERWLAHYERHGIVELRMGLVVVRRGFSREPWFHVVGAAGTPEGEGGRQLLRIIEAQDYLTSTGDLAPRLEDERLGLVDGHSIVQRNRFGADRYSPEDARLELTDGLGTVVTIEPTALEILLELDDRRTLGEILSALAPRLDVDAKELAAYGIETARELLALGLVVRL